MLNFALMDPNTPAKVANAFAGIGQPNRANMLADAQLKQINQQNALGEYKTLAAKQDYDTQSQMLSGLRAAGSDLGAQRAALVGAGKPAEALKLQEQDLVNKAKGLDFLSKMSANMSQDPSDENVRRWGQTGVDLGLLTPEMAKQRGDLLISLSPAERQKKMLLVNTDAKDQLAMLIPKLHFENTGANAAAAFNPYTGTQVTPGVAASPTPTAALRAEGQKAVQEGLSARSDPATVAAIAEARETGKALGKDKAQAASVLPKVVDDANTAIRLIDELIGDTEGKVKPHAGFSSTVGMTLTPGMRFVHGSDSAGFVKRLDQLKGASFLQAFDTLRGAGAISEKEGEKATTALNRMNIATSEDEFVAAGREAQEVYRKGVKNLQRKANAGAARNGTPQPSGGPLPPGMPPGMPPAASPGTNPAFPGFSIVR